MSALEDILRRLNRIENRLAIFGASGPMAGVLSAQVAATDSIVDVRRLERTTTGVAANGIGVGEVFVLQDASGNVEEAGNIDVVLTTAAHATQAAAMRLGVSGATVLSLTTGKASAGQLESTVAIGTAPLAVTSTTVCTNLNADTVDGIHGHAAITLGDHADHLLTLTGQALTTPNTNANVVYAGPASGAAASADWRSLVTADIAAEMITYAKLQHVSATDKLLGRATAGAGDVEEIACTAAGRALLADAAASNQCTTLGLGTGDGPTHDHLHITTPNRGNLITSGGVAGGIMRRTNMTILNGTEAAHIKCQTYSRWNGDNNAAQDNIGADGVTTGVWSLAAGGAVLSWLTGGIAGDPTVVLAANIIANTSGTALIVDCNVAGTSISCGFYNAATGAAVNLTTLVDTGYIYMELTYLTTA